MNKVDILGIHIQIYSAKEALRLCIGFLKNGAANTVYFLSAQALVAAGSDAALKEQIESMDIVMPTTADILEAAEPPIKGRSRETEIENVVFFRELMALIFRGRKKVFYLAETTKEVEGFLRRYNGAVNGLQVVGTYAYEELTGNEESIVNEINVLAPDVIISELPTPIQERFLFEKRKMVNASLWVALSGEIFLENKETRVRFAKLRRIIQKSLFKNAVSKYQVEKESAREQDEQNKP